MSTQSLPPVQCVDGSIAVQTSPRNQAIIGVGQTYLANRVLSGQNMVVANNSDGTITLNATGDGTGVIVQNGRNINVVPTGTGTVRIDCLADQLVAGSHITLTPTATDGVTTVAATFSPATGDLNMNGHEISNVATVGSTGNIQLYSTGGTVNVTSPSSQDVIIAQLGTGPQSNLRLYNTGDVYSTARINNVIGAGNASYFTAPNYLQLNCSAGNIEFYSPGTIFMNAPLVMNGRDITRIGALRVGNASWTSNGNDIFINANNAPIYFRSVDGGGTMLTMDSSKVLCYVDFQRQLSGVGVSQPIIQQGTVSATLGAGSVTVNTGFTPYTSTSSYQVFASGSGNTPLSISTTILSASSFKITYATAAANFTLSWTTIGT